MRLFNQRHKLKQMLKAIKNFFLIKLIDWFPKLLVNQYPMATLTGLHVPSKFCDVSLKQKSLHLDSATNFPNSCPKLSGSLKKRSSLFIVLLNVITIYWIQKSLTFESIFFIFIFISIFILLTRRKATEALYIGYAITPTCFRRCQDIAVH